MTSTALAFKVRAASINALAKPVPFAASRSASGFAHPAIPSSSTTGCVVAGSVTSPAGTAFAVSIHPLPLADAAKGRTGSGIAPSASDALPIAAAAHLA